MGKTSSLSQLKRNDKVRKFPELTKPLTKEDKEALDVLLKTIHLTTIDN
jgi:hypothetical protein